MPDRYPRSLMFLLILLGSPLALPATVMHADGIIRVKGDSWKGTRITVVPEFGPAYEVPMTKPHIYLELPLLSTYLIRAEHEGCPTKEVIFDLKLPLAVASQEYDFPFEILLEKQPEGMLLRYAGPVGLVSFDKSAGDFDYITDYRLIAVLIPKADELRERAPAELHPQIRIDNSTGGAGSPLVEENATSSPAQPVMSATLIAEPTRPEPRRVEVVRESTIQIEDLSDEDLDVAEAPTALSGPNAAAEVPPGRMVPGPKVTPEAHSEPPRSLPNARITDSHVPAKPVTTMHVQQPAPPPEPCGTSHMEITSRMVVLVQRMPNSDGGCSELKKVTHAYGAVFYFHDGRPVTEGTYELLASGVLK